MLTVTGCGQEKKLTPQCSKAQCNMDICNSLGFSLLKESQQHHPTHNDTAIISNTHSNVSYILRLEINGTPETFYYNFAKTALISRKPIKLQYWKNVVHLPGSWLVEMVNVPVSAHCSWPTADGFTFHQTSVSQLLYSVLTSSSPLYEIPLLTF